MNLDEIAEMTIKASAEGVAEAADALNKLAAAGDNVAVVSDKTAKLQTSAASAVDKYSRSLDVNYRNQQSLAKAQQALSFGLDQGAGSQDRYNQLLGLANDKYATTSGASKAFQTALSGVSGQLIALSAGAGPVGVFLSALGPWGVAGAVGIGALVSAYTALVESAQKTGEAAIATNRFLLTTGLAAEELSKLKNAASAFGLTGEDVGTRIDKFTEQFNALNEASGPLYTALLKINPAIAAQMVAARGAGSEIDLLAKAWNQATLAQQAAIDRAAFGRGGGSMGQLLGAVGKAGGIENMPPEIGDSTSAETKQLAAMTAQLNSTREATERLYASLSAKPVLEVLQKQADAALAVALNVKKAADAAADYAAKIMQHPEPALFSLNTPGVRNRLGKDAGLNDIGSQTGPSVANAVTGSGDVANINATAAAIENLNKKAEEIKVSATGLANAFKGWSGAMGAAVTPAQQLEEKLAELKKNYDDGVIAQRYLVGTTGDTAAAQKAAALAAADNARAQDILNESYAVDALNRNMAALGAAKTPAEQYKQTVSGLNLELREHKIDLEFATRGIAAAADAQRNSITAGREQLGVLTDQELQYNALKSIQDAWAKGFIKNDSDAAAAQAVLSKSVKETSDRMAVLRSPLPGLTQLGLDASNTAKQIDSLGTTSLNNLSNGLADIETGTVTLSAGIKNLEQQFIRSLFNMLNQMLIVAPIAKALQQTLGSFLPGGLGGVNPTVPGAPGVVGLNGPLPVPTYMADGGQLAPGNWAIVGERGPELLQTLPGGGANVHSNDNSARILASGLPGYAKGGYMPAPSGSGGNNVQVNVINNASGTTVEHRKSQNGGLDVHDVIISTVNQGIGKGQFDGANRARFGQQVRARPR